MFCVRALQCKFAVTSHREEKIGLRTNLAAGLSSTSIFPKPKHGPMMNVETQSSGRALWRTRVVAVLLLRGIVCCSAAQSALGRQHTDEDSNIICKAVEVIWDHVPENHGHEEGVTLASVASVDRALAVLHVSASWDDAVSIAMYARTDAEAIAIRSFILNTLAPHCESKGQLFHATLISSCTVKDSPDEVLSFPINKLRWHAVAAASTNIVLYVDVDFLPSKDASAMIRGAFNSGTVDRNEDLLILPCFVAKESSDWPIPLEIRDGGNGSLLINVDALTKPELHNRFLSKRVEMPGVPWSVSSQAATDYVQWFQVGIEPPALREDGGSASGYYIDYTAWYEPYFALDKSKWRGVRGAGMFDDRFEGWGGDKAEVSMEAAALGYRFMVHPWAFLVHVPQQDGFKCHELLGGGLCRIGEEVRARSRSEWKERSDSLYMQRALTLLLELPPWDIRTPSAQPSSGQICFLPPYRLLRDLSRQEALGLMVAGIRQVAGNMQEVNQIMKDMGTDQARHQWRRSVWKWCLTVTPLVGIGRVSSASSAAMGRTELASEQDSVGIEEADEGRSGGNGEAGGTKENLERGMVVQMDRRVLEGEESLQYEHFMAVGGRGEKMQEVMPEEEEENVVFLRLPIGTKCEENWRQHAAGDVVRCSVMTRVSGDGNPWMMERTLFLEPTALIETDTDPQPMPQQNLAGTKDSVAELSQNGVSQNELVGHAGTEPNHADRRAGLMAHPEEVLCGIVGQWKQKLEHGAGSYPMPLHVTGLVPGCVYSLKIEVFRDWIVYSDERVWGTDESSDSFARWKEGDALRGWSVSFEIPGLGVGTYVVDLLLEDASLPRGLEAMLSKQSFGIEVLSKPSADSQPDAGDAEQPSDAATETAHVHGWDTSADRGERGGEREEDAGRSECGWLQKWGRWRAWAGLRNWKVAKLARDVKRGGPFRGPWQDEIELDNSWVGTAADRESEREDEIEADESEGACRQNECETGSGDGTEGNVGRASVVGKRASQIPRHEPESLSKSAQARGALGRSEPSIRGLDTSATANGVLDRMKVVVFNLEKRKDRKLHMKTLLDGMRISNASFPQATLAAAVDINRLVSDGKLTSQGSEELSKQFGEKAMRAYVAHALDWLEEVEVALVENQEWVMLLEDDLGISAEPKEVAAQIEQSVALLPYDAHMLYLEACLENCNLIQYSVAHPGLARASGPYCSGAIVLTRLGMERVLATCRPVFHGIDHMLSALTFRQSLNSFLALPLPMFQDTFFGTDVPRQDSPLEGTDSNAAASRDSAAGSGRDDAGVSQDDETGTSQDEPVMSQDAGDEQSKLPSRSNRVSKHAPVAGMCWEEEDSLEYYVLDVFPPLILAAQLPSFLDEHQHLFPSECATADRTNVSDSAAHVERPARDVLSCDALESLGHSQNSVMQYIFLEKDLSKGWRIPRDGHVAYFTVDEAVMLSQDVGSWHNDTDGLYLSIGPRSVCWDADVCRLVMLLMDHEGNQLGAQAAVVHLGHWRRRRERADVDEETVMLAVLAETLRQPLGSVGTFDYAWRLDFALLHSNATDVGCAAGEASWDPEDAGHGDEWKGMTGRFLDWDTQFRDATMNSISNMSVEYLSRRALQACIQAAAGQAIQSISYLMWPAFLVAVPASVEEADAWSEYASVPEFGVSQRVQRGMLFLQSLCFAQVHVWEERPPMEGGLDWMVRKGSMSERGKQAFLKDSFLLGFDMADAIAMARGAVEVLSAVRRGVEAQYDMFVVAWDGGWIPAGSAEEVNRRVAAAVAELPASSDALFLGFKGETCSHLKYSSLHPSIAKAAKPSQATVMLLTAKGARHLLRVCWPVHHRLEVMIAKAIALTELDAYVMVPPAFAPAADRSGKFRTFSVCKEIRWQ